MAAIPITPLLIESFQQFEIGDYPYGNWTYPDDEVGNKWRPEKLINTSAENYIFNWTTAQGVRVGNSRSYYHTWLRSGYIEYIGNNRPSAGNPFGPFSDSALTVQATAAGYPDRTPLGVSIVPCPTRPGRKRLSLPGNNMPGKYQHIPTQGYLNANSLSIGFRYGIDNFNAGQAGCLSFVVRFPKRSLMSTLNSEWLVIVGRDNTQPMAAPGQNHGMFGMTLGSHQPWAIFGCGRQLQPSTATGAIGDEQTVGGSLPWVFFGHPRYYSANNYPVPNPTVAGADGGNWYKFEFDRDYHIELHIGAGTTVTQSCNVTAWVDGELVANAAYTYGTADVVQGTSAVAMPDAGYYRSNTRGFMISHSVAQRVGVTMQPQHFESLGKMLISDIVFGVRDKSVGAVYGPSTRVWGEMPNTDVDVQFKNVSGSGTNASVVGTPMSSSAVDPNRELHGTPGTEDKYKTEGSSLPDFAGAVQYIMSTSLVRTEGAGVNVSSTLEGQTSGSPVSVQPSTSTKYTRIDAMNNLETPIDPSVAAEYTFGTKVEGA